MTAIPPISVPEKIFLERWRRIDFTGWNETEVREGFIIDLLHTLGYRKGTTYDLEMEKPLRLAEPYHRVGRKKVAIDYAPSFRKRHFWIVEAKPGKPKEMSHGDLLQVHLYAVHPEVQARLVLLVNGWQVRVYDASTLTSFDDALLVVEQADERAFLELREMVGSRTMLKYQRTRLLDVLRETLASEVDVEAVDALDGALRNLARESRAKVQENAQQLWMASWRNRFETEGIDLRAASLNVLFVRMDEPFDGRPVPARELVRRVIEADVAGRARLVDEIAMHYRGRPHNIFRVTALRALVDLLDAEVEVPRSAYVPSVAGAVAELAQCNIEYWGEATLSNALCHLDNVAMRVSMKAAARTGSTFFDALTTAWKDAMTPRERVALRPDPATLVFATASHLQEVLWRWYCSKPSPEEIWDGIWNFHVFERALDELPPQPSLTKEDLIGAEFMGTQCDQLRAGTWNILRRSKRAAHVGLPSPLMAFIALPHESVVAGIPPERTAPTDWTPSRTVDELRDVLSKTFALRVAATLGRQIHPELPNE